MLPRRSLDGAHDGLASLPVLLTRGVALVAGLVEHFLQLLCCNLERLHEDGITELVEGHLEAPVERLHHLYGVLVRSHGGGVVVLTVLQVGEACLLALPREEDADTCSGLKSLATASGRRERS